METMTKKTMSGKVNKYRLTREKGFFTRHIWVYLNEKAYLHIIPTERNTGRMFKDCGEYGYLPYGELLQDFDNITLNNIPL